MPPVDTEYLVPSVPDIANQSAPLLLQQLQQQQYQQQQPLNANHNISLMLEPNQGMSSATSMNETQRLLRQNSTAAELGNLTGLLGEAGMVLQNVTLPMPALDTGLATLMDFKPLANETGECVCSERLFFLCGGGGVMGTSPHSRPCFLASFFRSDSDIIGYAICTATVGYATLP